MNTEIYITIKKILILGFLFQYLKNIINHLKEFQEKEEDINGIWFFLWLMKLNFYIFVPPYFLFTI